MKLNGQTAWQPQQNLPPELAAQLKALWVESPEELLAMLAAVGSENAVTSSAALTGPARSLALQLVPPAQLSRLTSGRPGGTLGCRLPPEQVEQYQREGRLGARRTQPPSGFADRRLPTSVRLMDQLFPVRDQGQRGTCVAFATVALREQLAGRQVEFSEQFLYWACKELDGIDGPGTYLRTAMSAMGEFGCCLAPTWPYEPQAVGGDETRGKASAAARQEALQYRMPDCRVVEPTLVLQYKQVLAGDGSVRGMPVVVGVLVFNSWYRSPETHRTGKITLPLPGEQPVSGHAMCIVGYVDDLDVPGGGYFITRNSWGLDWAADSPEAPGHALLPYAYVEMCANEAFTGPANLDSPTPTATADSLEGVVRRLERDGRDIEHRGLPAGTRVLFNPLAPDEYMEDDAAGKHRRRFEELDGAWTIATRQKVWFPRPAGCSQEFQRGVDAARSHVGHFFSAIEQNLQQSINAPFPLRHPPGWVAFLPYEWEPTVKTVSDAIDLGEEFAAAQQRCTGVPKNLPWPEEWAKLLREVNQLKVYCVAAGFRACHVVVAFVTPLRLVKRAGPELTKPTVEMLQAVRAVYQQWAAGRADVGECFFTVGIAERLPGDFPSPTGLAMDSLVTFSPDGSWIVCPRDEEIGRHSLRDYFERLKPETRDQRLSKIRKAVDEDFDCYTGNVSESRLKRGTGYRRSLVRDAFFHLQEKHSDQYCLEKLDSSGELIIKRPPKEGRVVPLTPSSFGSQIRRHILGISALAVGTGLAMGAGWLSDQLGLPKPVSYILSVLITYVGQLLQKAINKQVDKSKE
jgi:hypothetical protein